MFILTFLMQSVMIMVENKEGRAQGANSIGGAIEPGGSPAVRGTNTHTWHGYTDREGCCSLSELARPCTTLLTRARGSAVGCLSGQSLTSAPSICETRGVGRPSGLSQPRCQSHMLAVVCLFR